MIHFSATVTNMIHSRLYLILMLLLLSGSLAAQTHSRFNQIGTYQATLANNREVTISIRHSPAKYGNGWPEDYILLNFDFADADEPDCALHFHSSYGGFEMDLVDLDGDGSEEVVLVKGEGRGTSARSESLNVYRLNGGIMALVVSTPLSGYAGSGHWWQYDCQYHDTDGNGTCDILLQLDETVYETGGSSLIQAAVPRDARKVIRFSAATAQLAISP